MGYTDRGFLTARKPKGRKHSQFLNNIQKVDVEIDAKDNERFNSVRDTKGENKITVKFLKVPVLIANSYCSFKEKISRRVSGFHNW